MAITKDYPEIKVQVRVDKVALEEYDDDEEQVSGSTVTKYIEATSGATFDLRFEITPPWPTDSVLFDTYLDGRYVRGHFAQYQTYYGARSVQVIEGSNHTKDGQWFMTKFAFSALNIDDSDIRSVGDKLMKDIKDMGEIKIEGFFVKNVGESNDTELSVLRTSEFGNIPEKALKGRALSHQATLGAPEATSKGTILTYDHINSCKQPFITFKFKHRSKAALQSLLIIPRDPSPVPLEQRDVNTLTLQETRELIRLQRARGDATRNVKREGVKRERSSTIVDGDEEDDEVSFVSVKRRRLPITLDEDGIETIDLT